jgi:hypothetical protein
VRYAETGGLAVTVRAKEREVTEIREREPQGMLRATAGSVEDLRSAADSPGRGKGRELAVRKSELARTMQRLEWIKSIFVIDDNARDSQHITAILHLLLGRTITARVFRSVPAALMDLKEGQPDILFLDDWLPPTDRAESSLRSLRRQGLVAPVIIMSGMLTIERRKALMGLDILGIIHKDDVDSFSVAQILTKLVDGA